MRDLKGMFEPKSIAVVGASRDPQKVGAIVLKNIIRGGYNGKIYPINPNIESVGQMKFYKSVNYLPEVPDLLVVAVPANVANTVVEDAGKFGIKNIVIFSAGYKEEGDAGKILEEELKSIAQKYSLNILGPNCLGFNNLNCNLNATFGANIEQKGNLRIISQSGAIATALIDWGHSINLGFDQLISLGNKAVINENDVINYWTKSTPSPSFDKEGGSCFPTGMYLESISDGKELVKILKNYTKNNPVFVIKPGKSSGAQRAMMSHTGAIAGEDSILNEAIAEAGAIRCEELSDFFDMCRVFSNNKTMRGDRVAVVTNAGGPAVLTTDTVEKYGLKMAEISDETKSKLDESLPRMASFINPIDVLGDSLSARFGEALEIVLQEKNVDAVVAILTPQLMTEIEKTAEVIGHLSAKYDKPSLCSFIGGSKVAAGENILNEKNIPNFDYPERAIYCLAKMWEWKESSQKSESLKVESSIINVEEINKVIYGARENKQKVLDSFQSNELIKAMGLSVPETEKIEDANAGIKFAKKNGWPVVLKISGSEVLHKSELGGVVTNIRSEYQLKKSFEKIKQVDYDVQIQQQIEGGVEVILGIKRDPNFGPVLLFGAGGKMAELIKDRNLRLLPLTEDKVEMMINESKVYTLLNGFRNDKKYELSEFKKVIFAMEQLITENNEIEEMEINPVIITHGKSFCVDVKVKLQ